MYYSKGWIVQYDTPENILKNPANEYVQNFVGKIDCGLIQNLSKLVILC